MIPAFVGLGANLGDPLTQLRAAIAHLRGHEGFRLLAVSSFYRSAPLGPADQPEYGNAVAQIETGMPAPATLDALLAIEKTMGRQRDDERWGPRRIDLDLLLFGDAVIHEPGLTIPHPEMHRRNFVMRPLAEIAPDTFVPGQGKALAIADALGDEDLNIWEQET